MSNPLNEAIKNPHIEILILDIFDAPTGSSISNLFLSCVGVDDDGAPRQVVDGDAILRSPKLHANLAFHAAWVVLTGAFASRNIYWWFDDRMRLHSARSPNETKLAIVSCLHETVLEYLPSSRIARQMDEHVQTAALAYDKAVKEFGESPVKCKRTVYEKIMDRHCLLVPLHSDMLSDLMREPVMEGIARIYSDHAFKTLSVVETWIDRHDPILASTRERETRKPSSGLEEYTIRSTSAISSKQLGCVNPISSFRVADSFPDEADFVPPQWSCIEALRHSIFLDGCLWRTDSGGAIYVSHAQTPPHMLALLNTCFIRHVCMPWKLFLSACPRGIYKRVIILTDGSDDDEIDRFKQLAIEGDYPTEIIPFHCTTTPHYKREHRHGRYIDSVTVISDIGGCDRNDKTLDAYDAKRLVFPITVVDITESDESAELGAVGDVNRDRGGHGRFLSMLECIQRSLLHNFATFKADDCRHIHYDFMIRYLAIRARWMFFDDATVRVSDPPNRSKLGDVIMIDNRPNIWSILSLFISLDNVDRSRWSCTVFCGLSNIAFMERHISAFLPDARIIPLPALSGQHIESAFNIESYNLLLKDKNDEFGIWGNLHGTYALLIQDDGILVRRGIEDDPVIDIMSDKYDYIGAPWSDVPANDKLKKLVPSLVGNGGLSLRRVSSMRLICSKISVDCLFNFNLQPIPEDVFFAMNVYRNDDGRMAPTEVGERFAFEQRAPSKITPPYGFHKPWPYLVATLVSDYMDAVLMDAKKRSCSR